jgi:hypothetical protein
LQLRHYKSASLFRCPQKSQYLFLVCNNTSVSKAEWI